MMLNDFTLDLFSLAGRNAVVTGGNTGLGQAFSLALAKAGANVMMPSIMPDDPEFNRLIAAQGVAGLYLETDITEEGSAKQIVSRCIAEFGSIDILINCAGINRLGDFSAYSKREWEPMIHTNLSAIFELSHEAALPMIAQRSGKIINICSLYSFLGGRGSVAYAAAKHGLVGLTRALCDELAEYNIQVNGIAPGYFSTQVTEKTRSDPERNRWIVDHTPHGSWGEPADLMGAAVFLASGASRFVNGHILVVDGGFLTR
jgi:NAD(P)-dependent dehydrogenase (short-subunit alcohol dehydrogenase family)